MSLPQANAEGRTLWFSPDGKTAYLLNELAGNIIVYSYEDGKFTPKQTIASTTAGDKNDHGSAEIVISPNGKFLYASNRGADNIAIFSIDAKSGMLTPLEFVSAQGKTPGSFSIDPSGSWMIVANQASDSLVIFRLDGTTGKLLTSERSIQVGTPSCVRFLPVRPRH